MKTATYEQGIAILSFDTEQIWGHLDYLNDAQFLKRYPGAIDAHDRLLQHLCAADIRATWFVVGGMALPGSNGREDLRMKGLPADWTSRIPPETERTAPLWYRRSFVDRLREASPQQEIGLHGGLTHLIWTEPGVTREVAERELAEGARALQEAGVSPYSFSHPREQEKYHDLLPKHGIGCYRSKTPTLDFRLGRTLPGAALRILNEMRRGTPPPVWPSQTSAGLWAIPASLFLYPIGPSRTRFAALKSRVQRFRRGLETAARHKGIFHYCFHPDNLTESPDGFSMLDDMLALLIKARRAGDIQVSGMGDVARTMQAQLI
jgi:hypothetical protein